MTLTTPTASPTIADLLATIKLDLFDSDALNPVLQDPEYLRELGNAWVLYQGAYGNRYVRLDATASFGGIVSQNASGRSAIAAPLNVLEWKELFYEGTSTGSSQKMGQPLEILPHEDVILAQRMLGQGTPRYAALTRIAGTGVADNGVWWLYLAPMPNANIYVSSLVRRSPYTVPTDGSGNSDSLDCPPADATSLAHATAALIAEGEGYGGTHIDGLWKKAGQQMQDLLRVTARSEPQASRKANAG